MIPEYCVECGGGCVTSVQALGCAMSQVGRGVELRFERFQVEEVFGLTGGELADKPIEFISRRRNNWEELTGWERCLWRYSYDGAPEWATEDFGGRHHYDHSDYFTLIETGLSYESYAPEEIFFPGAPIWTRHYLRARQYTGDREVECNVEWEAKDNGGNSLVGEGETKGMQRCPMCAESAGEEHGYIYLGICTETVYRRVDFRCAECKLARSEMLEDAETECQCNMDELLEALCPHEFVKEGRCTECNAPCVGYSDGERTE